MDVLQGSRGDEDLEDGEIFDDDDEENKEKETQVDSKTEKAIQPSDFTSNKKETKTGAGEGGSTKDGAHPPPVATSNSVKNSQHYQNTAWRKAQTDANEEAMEKKNKKSKKRKRRRGDDDEGDIKSDKKKKIRKILDKESFASDDPNCGDNIVGRPGEDELADDDEDDDDEMLFVRGASPQSHNHHSNNNSRHFKDGFQSDGDNEEMDHDFDIEDDYMENDDEFDDCDDGERRSGPPHPNMSRLDRTVRRDRMSIRGKRRGHGNMGSRKKRDDNEVCIFYMQGKCHKGNDCQFSHEAMPHKKQELCKFYLMECCNKKDKCLYMHSEFPCKYFHMGLKCYANKTCRFSHSKLSDSMRQVFIKTFGPIRSKGEFPIKKGSVGKHSRPQEPGGDFGRPRDGRREADGGGGSREKKIPSLFDIKVSIPDEMRKDYNSDSDGGGNRTPMPSPPIDKSLPAQQTSDSSRSPPQIESDAVPSSKRRRKERRNDRPARRSNGPRDRGGNDSDNENTSRRLMLPGGPFSNDSWDDIDHEDMLHRLRMEYNNLKDEDSCSNNNSNSFGSNHDKSGITHSSSAESTRVSGSQPYQKAHNKYDSDASEGSDTLKHEGSATHDGSTSAGGQPASLNDSNNEMFPAHLPKKQRELFLRIQQQQRQASESNNGRPQQLTNDGEEFKEVGSDGGDRVKFHSENSTGSVSTFSDKLNASKLSDTRSQSDDLNWYSSDEEDYQQSAGVGSAASTSISAILQNLVKLNNNNSESAGLGSTLNNSLLSGSCELQTSDVYNNARLTPPTVPVNSTDSSSGRNNVNSTAGISNVDFDVNEVSELLSKVKQHFLANEKKAQEKRRDPRLRSDVGPSGDSVNSSSSSSASLNSSGIAGNTRHENHVSSLTPQNNDDDHRFNTSESRGAGAGDMDLRNLPFKPAPVHSAATEIDASINSYVPSPYKLIPIVVPKPDYSSVQLNSKVGAADPRLRKSVRLSEDPSSVVSSRDPRQRLIDDITKTKASSPTPSPTPAPVSADPRQRSRAVNAPVPSVDEQVPSAVMLPPSLSHVRPAYPVMPGMDPNAVHPPPSSRICEEPMQPYPPPSPMINTPPTSRPNDPRQRHSQPGIGMQPPATQAQAAALFDVLTAMNSRQPGFLTQTSDPRSRPPGMPNIVFPGAVMRPNNSSVNKGQYGFK